MIMLTLDEIMKKVAIIKDLSVGDPELAHIKEDKLRADFIQFIAECKYPLGLTDIKQMAKLIISTEELFFPKNYG